MGRVFFVGPIFMEDNLTVDRCLQILKELVEAILVDIVVNNNRNSELQLFSSTTELHLIIPNQWIRRSYAIEWLSRSLDFKRLFVKFVLRMQLFQSYATLSQIV